MKLASIAARAGRWSVRHRRRAILGWVALVVLLTVAGGAAGMSTLSVTEKGLGESGRAEQTLNDNEFTRPAQERILVESGSTRAGQPAFDAGVSQLVEGLEQLPSVAAVSSPLERGGEALLARDGHAALIQFELGGSIDDGAETVAPSLALLARAQRDHPELRISQAGDGSIDKAITEQTAKDFRRAELSAVPLTLAVLAIAFGALVAALVPVALGLSAVAAAIGLLSLLSHGMPFEENVNSIVLLVGLAVGVDYALFYQRRVREEREAGRSETAAIEAAAATSGHAVLVSGLTIVAAVAGMFLAESPYYRSFAAGIIVVVVLAMVGSLTVLPALLAWLGDRVERGRLPLERIPAVRARRARRAARVATGAPTGITPRVVDVVLRRPRVSALLALALLLALAAPAVFGLRLADHGTNALPQQLAVTQAAERINAAFPGGDVPATVVVSGGGDLREGARAEALAAFAAALRADDRIGAPVISELNAAGDVARIAVPLRGAGNDEQSERGLDALREELIPATLERAGLQADVAGATAASADQRADTVGRGPLIVGLVLLLSFVVLTVSFRSLVVALKAVVLNVLSIAAAFGVLVLVFQEGRGHELLGFTPDGSITTWLPVFMFLLLFGLSMDYHVFILSRIREAVDGGMSTPDAVRFGLTKTAGVVTSAAVVMVAVFGIFATLSQLDVKQIGVGLAAAVLIDATIVRIVLLPAAMVLLGERNWWLPKPLARLLAAPAAQPLPADGELPAATPVPEPAGAHV
jgi:RND superfamily putative drug exporter